MAGFFEKIKSKKKEEINITADSEKEREEFRYFGSPDERPLTSESAREQLERNIEIKLRQMRFSEFEFPESVNRDRTGMEAAEEKELRSSEKEAAEESVFSVFSEPLFTDVERAAGFAVEQEPVCPEPEVPEVPLDNQIAFKDIVPLSDGDEEVPPSEKQAKEKSSFAEGLSAELTLGDKVFYVIGYPFAAAYRALKKKSHSHVKELSETNPEKHLRIIERQKRILARLTALRKRFIEADKRIAARLVHAVNRFDKRNDALADKAVTAVISGGEKWDLAKEWAELNKTRLLFSLGAVIGILLFIFAMLNAFTAYEYSYNGKTLGLVKDQEDVLRIVDIVSDQLAEENEVEIFINKEEDISFRKVFSTGRYVDSPEQVLSRLTYMKDIVAHAAGIYIDDKRAVILQSKDSANKVLNRVLSAFLPSGEAGTQYEKADFVEKVEIREVETKLGRIESESDAVRLLLNGKETSEVHLVLEGETFSGIAEQHEMTLDELALANPDVDPDTLAVGQDLSLKRRQPMLTVQTVEVSTFTEDIPFTTTYLDDPSMYKGETTTKVVGVPGEREAVYKIVKSNGTEAARLELSAKVLREPVTAVVYSGTKDLPPRQGTGTFIYPVSGARLSSTFGKRWGRMHYGIDLACATGTKIRASDGGTVVYAAYSGSYGNVVKIDHGGGFVTVYAHCSKILVSVGTKVYQGQHIANVGSTGRSTGPHCHFEVQYLGVQKNPLNYL